MPLASEVYQEGLIIPPIKLVERGRMNQGVLALICRNVRTPDERRGDLAAQIAAQRLGERRLAEAAALRHGVPAVREHAAALLAYSERMMRAAIRADSRRRLCLSRTSWTTTARAAAPVRIAVRVTIAGDQATVDFTRQRRRECRRAERRLAVTCSAVYYVFTCLAGDDAPPNHGCYAPIHDHRAAGHDRQPTPAAGRWPAAMWRRRSASSTACLGALASALPERIPAASQGTMNNLTVGGV